MLEGKGGRGIKTSGALEKVREKEEKMCSYDGTLMVEENGFGGSYASAKKKGLALQSMWKLRKLFVVGRTTTWRENRR